MIEDRRRISQFSLAETSIFFYSYHLAPSTYNNIDPHSKTQECTFILDQRSAEDNQRLAKLEKLERKYEAVARSKTRGKDKSETKIF